MGRRSLRFVALIGVLTASSRAAPPPAKNPELILTKYDRDQWQSIEGHSFHLDGDRVGSFLPEGKLLFFGPPMEPQDAAKVKGKYFERAANGKLGYHKLEAEYDFKDQFGVFSRGKKYVGVVTRYGQLPCRIKVFDATGKKIGDFTAPEWRLEGRKDPLAAYAAAFSDQGFIALKSVAGPDMVRLCGFDGQILAGEDNDLYHLLLTTNGVPIVWSNYLNLRAAHASKKTDAGSMPSDSFARILNAKGELVAAYEPENPNVRIRSVVASANAGTIVFEEDSKGEHYTERVTVWRPASKLKQTLPFPSEFGHVNHPVISPDGLYVAFGVGATGVALLRPGDGKEKSPGPIVWVKDFAKSLNENAGLWKQIVQDAEKRGRFNSSVRDSWRINSAQAQNDGSVSVFAIADFKVWPTGESLVVNDFQFEIDAQGQAQPFVRRPEPPASDARPIEELAPQPAPGKKDEATAVSRNQTKADDKAATTASTRKCRVVNSDSQPIANARVGLCKTIAHGSAIECQLLEECSTDKEGYFSFPSPPDFESIDCTVSAKGYETRRLRVESTTKEPLSLLLRRTVTIRGTVLSPDGKPLANAPLSLSSHIEHERPVDSRDDENADRAITDDQGRFEFKNVPPGRHVVRYPWASAGLSEAQKKQWEKFIPAGQAEVPLPVPNLIGAKQISLHEEEGNLNDIQLPLYLSSCAAEGRLLDEKNRPLVGRMVSLAWRTNANGGSQRISGSGYPPAVTDAEGRFHMSNLPPGHWCLDAWEDEKKPDSLCGLVDVVLVFGKTIQLDLHLPLTR